MNDSMCPDLNTMTLVSGFTMSDPARFLVRVFRHVRVDLPPQAQILPDPSTAIRMMDSAQIISR